MATRHLWVDGTLREAHSIDACRQFVKQGHSNSLWLSCRSRIPSVGLAIRGVFRVSWAIGEGDMKWWPVGGAWDACGRRCGSR